MTLLQRSDGDDASKGVSYLELAEFIMQQGAQPAQDLEQLWRRIVFYICVSNVDDHLRNHGFLKSKRADKIIQEIWRYEASRLGIAVSEQNHMASAFRSF